MIPDHDAVAPIAALIKSRTRPGDRVFVVAGQREAIRYHADRLPASRFLDLEDSMGAYTGGHAQREMQAALAALPPPLLVVGDRHRWFEGTTAIECPVARRPEPLRAGRAARDAVHHVARLRAAARGSVSLTRSGRMIETVAV